MCLPLLLQQKNTYLKTKNKSYAFNYCWYKEKTLQKTKNKLYTSSSHCNKKHTYKKDQN
jgi:hypothetical protein